MIVENNYNDNISLLCYMFSPELPIFFWSIGYVYLFEHDNVLKKEIMHFYNCDKTDKLECEGTFSMNSFGVVNSCHIMGLDLSQF